MFLRRLYDERLAQASYMLGCQASGEALVVDPSRRVGQYLDLAKREGLRVTHVTETHIHADFVSGARELAHETGARLFLSGTGTAGWRYGYAGEAGAELLQDGGCLRVGSIEVSAMHTPGHTPEHLAFLVTDRATAQDAMGAFTGDFLFVGDVGRPDLLEKAAKEKGTAVTAARQLFQSLRRFAALPDFLQIWPGHGAGSSCGKSLGAVPQSTLGYEKLANWAFVMEDEDEFVEAVLEGQPHPPRYFAMMKRVNRDGPKLLASAPKPVRMPAERIEEVLAAGATVVDTRPAKDFARGAVPGSINLPFNRSFTTYAGTILPYDRDLYLVADETADEIARELSGIGLDRLVGLFATAAIDGRRQRGEALSTVPAVSVEAVESVRGRTTLLDVRNPGEFEGGHIPGALNIPLGDLPSEVAKIPRDRAVVVHCQSGSRAAIAASLLLAAGLKDVRLFSGGFSEWRASGKEIEAG